MENYFFLENYITSERAVSQNVLYYQQLPITRLPSKVFTTAFNVAIYVNSFDVTL